MNRNYCDNCNVEIGSEYESFRFFVQSMIPFERKKKLLTAGKAWEDIEKERIRIHKDLCSSCASNIETTIVNLLEKGKLK